MGSKVLICNNLNKFRTSFSNEKLPIGYVCIYPTLLPYAGCDTRPILKQSNTGLNLDFTFSLTGYNTKAKEPRLPYYFPRAVRRSDGFMPVPRALAQNEM